MPPFDEGVGPPLSSCRVGTTVTYWKIHIGKCSDAADGAECGRGRHLCCRKGCHAPHPEKEEDRKAK